MIGVAIDPQARGWHDDGTESGLVRSRPVRSRLVAWPLLQGHYQVDLTGTATRTVITGQALDNSDGTGIGVSLNAPATAVGIGCGARLWTVAYGSVIAVRYRRDSTVGDFVAWVDGVPVYVTGKHTYLINESVTIIDGEAWTIIADDLDPTIPHYVVIDVFANPTAANTVLIFGLGVDRLAGYPEVVRASQHTTPAAVPTASLSNLTMGPGTSLLRTVQSIHYYNSTAGALTVSLGINGVVFAVVSVPANSSTRFDVGAPTAFSVPQHQASGAGVTYTIIGSY